MSTTGTTPASESWFRYLKERCVWRTRAQLELAVVEYVSWFNHDRLHGSLR